MVKTGQVVKVKVLEVDDKRKRIALTLRLTDSAPQGVASRGESRQNRNTAGKTPRPAASPPSGTMAAAFARLKK
ncbi:MAG: S1 RNA-binding domain-containing protein [Thiobacillus sp.]